MNLHIQIMRGATVDYRLIVSATNDNNQNIATITSMDIDDPNLQVRLRDIARAFEMGAKFGTK